MLLIFLFLLSGRQYVRRIIVATIRHVCVCGRGGLPLALGRWWRDGACCSELLLELKDADAHCFNNLVNSSAMRSMTVIYLSSYLVIVFSELLGQVEVI